MKRTFIIIAMLALASAAWAAGPVTVAIQVTGDPIPGATITAKAVPTITDGSTLQSITWTQKGGVPVTLASSTGETVSITLASRKDYRAHLCDVLEEPPLSAAELPAHIPALPFEGGLQNRFAIAGVSPHAAEEAGAAEFELTVVTTSGTYKVNAEVVAKLPWLANAGLRNIPVGVPIVIHGKTQATYNWALAKPAGSTAALADPTTQHTEFTPDVAGTYTITVKEEATDSTVTMAVHAGKWTGMIAGEDAEGRPVADAACTTCHVKNTPHFDLFTPWSKSGHAQIFTQNVKDNSPTAHYSENCISCHTIGYNLDVNNGGIDDAADFQALRDSGMLQHGGPANWTNILAQFPQSARRANIQCENCHGPQDSAAHMKKDGSRKTLSSDLCGTCHGEPARHGRYQQWQLSGHANYELAREEGADASCGKCHSAQGFIQWIDKDFTTANLTVDWNVDTVHPQTCATCHDPHDVGTTSGNAATNATVRVTGETPMLLSGFKATNVGNAALCMTCHNGRRGLRNDSNFSLADATRAPHVGPQADVLMGQNMYFVPTGKRGFHSMVADSCIACHMEKSDPPAGLANKNSDGTFGGTNHTFFASNTICSKCHSNITAAAVQGAVETKMEELKSELETAILTLMQNQIRAGNSIDIGGTLVKSAGEIEGIEFIESHGRQGLAVDLSGDRSVPEVALNAVKVVRPAGTPVELYSIADPSLGKAGWNYFMVHSDKSKGVHNPTFVTAALDVSLYAVKAINNAAVNGVAGMVPAAIGGGIGNGAGAVACTTPYVYWTEVAGHTPGINSDWRTDIVTRNLSSSDASLKFYLHHAGGQLEGTATVPGSSQKGFEDIVALIGGTNVLGSLEICSNQPLLVMGRIFNQSPDGTYGQNIEGHVADLGYNTGQTFSLIGLRQKTDAFRSNIFFMNGGATEAQISVTLFNGSGQSLTTYTVTVPAGQMVVDGEPFKNRATQPDVDWGFAQVTVLKGTNIRTLGSLVDMKTNDPTTIPAKQ